MTDETRRPTACAVAGVLLISGLSPGLSQLAFGPHPEDESPFCYGIEYAAGCRHESDIHQRSPLRHQIMQAWESAANSTASANGFDLSSFKFTAWPSA